MYKGQVFISHGMMMRVTSVIDEHGRVVEPFDDMPPGEYKVIVAPIDVSTDLDAEAGDS